MQQLNLPSYKFRIKSKENKYFIFDIIRKKYVSLTPEEWVRQHIVHFLIGEKNYPVSLIAIEKQIKVNNLCKRTDILVFNSKGFPNIIVECKAPNNKLNQTVFDQIARYNLTLDAEYLMLTNGLEHYYCAMDKKNECYVFLENIPNYRLE